jgi:predicted O-methyltransferase YrrM
MRLSNSDQVTASVASPFQIRRCPQPLLDELMTTGEIEQGDGTKKPLQVYIPREEGDFLYSVVRDSQPDLTVEIGMANGFSSLCIAQALHENGHGRHIAIDPFQSSDWGCAGLVCLRRAGLEHLVRLIEKPSHQALPELEQTGLRAQFIFIDGSHLFDYVMTDFLCADRILDVGGLMAFDDSDWPAITQVIRFALTNRKYEVVYPEVVIEPPSGSPSILGRLARRIGRAIPAFGEKLRNDFLTPSHELEVRGRCVVLRKVGQDDRNSQSQHYKAF